jgi:carbamoyl-phosphate synthase small subunit
MNDAQYPVASLMLEDGTIFHGKAVGLQGVATGEICFNTGMTGYQEIFTDPSYFGQLLVTTNAHIGNYGTRKKEAESDSVKISGLICKNFSERYSRKKAKRSLQEYFEKEGIVGIADIDTRALVRHIRSKGAMNAIISSENTDADWMRSRLENVPSMDGLELASKVSTPESYTFGDEESALHVAVLDFGVKLSILRNIASRGCYLKVFPATTQWEEIEAWKPDGYFLSNGPGDPGAMDYAVDTVKQILAANKPLFGICLGHQLLARAVGIPTYKMHHGHRGINHPVKNLISQRSEITTQNHGFGVSPEAIRDRNDEVEVTHINLNDGTIEGMRIIGKPAFSVQYHPEACPGPHDSSYLFDDFVRLMQQ